jgi:hypothetical protein
MEKRVSRLVRDNSHPFGGQKVIFATKHEKEVILAPLFEELGISLIPAKVDTDILGTFSGEVERAGTIRETLRAKLRLAIDQNVGARYFLASEGSFGPHPTLGWIPSDLESLMLFDSVEETEIYVEFLSTTTVHAEIEIGARDDFSAFLQRAQFPSHGLIVRPSDSFDPIFRGLCSLHELQQALLDSFATSISGRVKILSDLRAHMNPTRRIAIAEAGKKLIEALKSFCPQCNYPGFRIVDGMPGLPCSACGAPSSLSKDVVWECPKCFYTNVSSRPDGVSSIGPESCDSCNP